MKSKELQEMEAEDLEQEPSLDQMVDLKDPKVLQGLGRLAQKYAAESLAQKPGSSSGSRMLTPSEVASLKQDAKTAAHLKAKT